MPFRQLGSFAKVKIHTSPKRCTNQNFLKKTVIFEKKKINKKSKIFKKKLTWRFQNKGCSLFQIDPWSSISAAVFRFRTAKKKIEKKNWPRLTDAGYRIRIFEGENARKIYAREKRSLGFSEIFRTKFYDTCHISGPYREFRPPIVRIGVKIFASFRHRGFPNIANFWGYFFGFFFFFLFEKVKTVVAGESAQKLWELLQISINDTLKNVLGRILI